MAGSQHFHREIEKLRKKILELAAIVELQVHRALEVIGSRDENLCKKIVESDCEINQTEVDIEEECLKILALYHPVATDLRFLVAVIKINNDLERIGDIAASIATRVAIIARHPKVEESALDFTEMGDKVARMFRLSLDSLMKVDSDLAHKVCAMDEDIDEMRNVFYGIVKKEIRKQPELTAPLMNLFLISRHLERLADHTTNIAEEVIYMRNGEIVRGERFN